MTSADFLLKKPIGFRIDAEGRFFFLLGLNIHEMDAKTKTRRELSRFLLVDAWNMRVFLLLGGMGCCSHSLQEAKRLEGRISRG